MIGLGFTWRNIKATEKNLIIAQENTRATQETATKNIAIALEGQITDRFTKAIEQLGDDRLEVRLGGIYGLERIAKDSEKDHWPIMEILTAYVRENSAWKDTELTKDPPRTDIQAILTILGRRVRTLGKGETEGQRLNLYHTDLRGTMLFQANLAGATLLRAHLEYADLKEAQLEKTWLQLAHLEHAVLEGANLNEADLREAHLERANLVEAQMKEACFNLADLSNASLVRGWLEHSLSKPR